MEFSQGWDSLAVLIDDRWVERRPRRPDVADQLRRETRLLPWLAPRLPLAVPVPAVVGESPLVVRHALVPGAAIESPTAEHGLAIGAFLRALHGSPADDAMRHGLPTAAETRDDRAATVRRFRAEVVPMVPADRRARALAILDAAQDLPADTVVHGDLGPEHILVTGDHVTGDHVTGDHVTGDHVTGVIDFGDTHLGDAAIDLAWPLYGAPAAFATAVATAYGVTDALRRRALIWHQLGPWHEVTYGADIDDPETVRSGLAGVLDRLDLTAD
ncbi:phosphotransferase [Nocardia sp. NPDC050718]|uniref:phosphotransferase n=1 Tax=Nocardia sp. NPDC050718 TaxID=3155788 RepID=UPI0033D35828